MITVEVTGWTRHGTLAHTTYEIPVLGVQDDLLPWLEENAHDLYQVLSYRTANQVWVRPSAASMMETLTEFLPVVS